MMYYISRRLGSGIPGQNDGFRSELHEWLSINYPEYKNGTSLVTHVFPWTIGKYDLPGPVHQEAIALPQVFAFPDGLLDRTLESLSITTPVTNKLQSMGLNTSWMTIDTTIRHVINFIQRTIRVCEWADQQVDVNNDLGKRVTDLTPAQRATLKRRSRFDVDQLPADAILGDVAVITNVWDDLDG